MRQMNTEELLHHLATENDDALELLKDVNVNIPKRFNKIVKSLSALIEEVRVMYPDANYYVNDDQVCLMLGHSHSEKPGEFQPHSNTGLMAVTSLDLIGRIGGGGW